MKSSYSNYGTYKLCPYILHLRKSFPDLRQEDGRGAVVGSCVHLLAERFLKGTCDDTSIFATIDTVFREHISKTQIMWRGASDKDLLKSQIAPHVINMLELFKKLNVTPKTCIVEGWLSVQFDVMRVNGRLDIMQPTDSGPYRILDIKTSPKPPDTDQMLVYAYMVRAKGLAVSEAGFLNTASGLYEECKLDMHLEFEVMKNMFRAAKAEEAGSLPPISGMHCKFCDFRRCCQYVYKPSVGLSIPEEVIS